jgi:hypothetical protein
MHEDASYEFPFSQIETRLEMDGDPTYFIIIPDPIELSLAGLGCPERLPDQEIKTAIISPDMRRRYDLIPGDKISGGCKVIGNNAYITNIKYVQKIEF